MNFTVPAYSQFLDIKNKKWKQRSCGVVALKMNLDYYRATNISFSKLIREGIRHNAYIPHIGWKHKGIVTLAKKYGFRGQNFDLANKKTNVAAKKLFRILKSKPVIASIYKNLKPKASGHLVVLTGIKNNIMYYNDPDSKTRGAIRRKAPMQKFLKGWKKRIIVVRM